MTVEDDPPPSAPAWILTYADMMSLLLTFFIMLVSMGELKQTDKFQGIADSLHLQFGYDSSSMGMLPGQLRPRNSILAAMALLGRSKRQDALDGGLKERAPPGDVQRVRIVRPGNRTTIGAAIFFDERPGKPAALELSEQNKAELRHISDLLGGKPQKIEVRGHSSARPASPGVSANDHWELAYRRARATMQFLVDDLKIDPGRIRISAAGPFEPAHLDSDPQQIRENPRVEVFLLEEVAGEHAGVPAKPVSPVAP